MTPRERFNNLPVDIKSTILEKHHDINTTHDWWDSVQDQFSEDMEALGIHVTRMYFSGFWSQGDGACFDGCIYDWGKYLTSQGITDPALIKLADDSWELSVAHSGHYYHENCTRVSSDLPMPTSMEDDEFSSVHSTFEADSLHEAVWMTQLMAHAKTDFEQLFIDNLRDHMRDLYRRLEEDYDYLTSDEAVLDTLDANDLLEDAINDTLESEDA